MKRTYRGAIGLTGILLCGVALPAMAQVRPAQTQVAANTPTGLEEVVVTARRRAEGVEHVPATINVLTSAALVKQGIHTEQDLQTAVPGLMIREQNSQNLYNYVIRGESLDGYSGAVPGVQPYINEVPLSPISATSFYDIENVQVLKGPQGTLFGRNTTGGAVLYQTTRPKDEFGGYVSVQYGNLDRLITEGALNLPLVEDKVLLRIAGTYTSGGAFMYNLYNDKYLGDQQEQSGRATLLLKPVEHLTNLTSVEYSGFGGTPQPSAPYFVVPCGQPGGAKTCQFQPSNPAFEALIHSPTGTYLPDYPGTGFIYPGGLPGIVSFLKSRGRYDVDLNAPFYHSGHTLLLSNTTTYEISPAVTIKNIFGYGDSISRSRYDESSLPYALLQSAPNLPGGDMEIEAAKDFSDEFQFQGRLFANKLNYIVGVFLDDEQDEFNSPLELVSYNAAAAMFLGRAIRYHQLAEDKSVAVFSQVTYALTDRLNLTGGIRGTWVGLTSQQLAGSILGNAFQQTDESNPSWNVSLDYHFTSDLMGYVTTRGSWRIGGYNPSGVPTHGDTVTAAQSGNYFLPETVKDVEVGAKYNGHVGGVPFQLNMDGYYVWENNVQKSGDALINGNISSATTNVPAATVVGIEGDFQVKPTPWLRLGGNISYNDPQFTQKQSVIYGQFTDFGPYGDAPRYSGAAFVEFTLPLSGDAGILTYRTDVFAQSSFWVANLGNTFTPHAKLPGYGLVNMRLDWANPVGAKGITASLFVKNLGNKLYYVGGSGSEQTYSDTQVLAGPPRTYGVVLRYAF